jgi:plastocyanin
MVSMQKIVGLLGAVGLLAAGAGLVLGPVRATAQGGGAIEAEVKYNGAPVVKKLKVNKDTEKCGTEATIEEILVGGTKGLAHAVVSVPTAKGEGKKDKAVIDQQKCRFVPHVVAMTPGAIDIKNSDDILHNIHTYSTANPAINKAQPKFRKVMTEKFDKPEMIKVTCDVHSWMLGWIAVVSTPFHAVTTDAGTVKIDNVPPGKHTVEVWHPALGKQTKEVEVKAGAPTKVSFEMKGK